MLVGIADITRGQAFVHVNGVPALSLSLLPVITMGGTPSSAASLWGQQGPECQLCKASHSWSPTPALLCFVAPNSGPLSLTANSAFAVQWNTHKIWRNPIFRLSLVHSCILGYRLQLRVGTLLCSRLYQVLFPHRDFRKDYKT